MRIRNMLRSGRLLLVVWMASVLCAGSALASGIDPLDGLVPPIGKTEVLNTGNGLIFTGFEFASDGGLDPSEFESLIISATTTGLQITGPLSVSNTNEASLYLTYQVMATGAAVNGVTQIAQTSVIDGVVPSFVKTSKTILDVGGSEVAFVETSNFEGLVMDSDSAPFAPLTQFTVRETIRISSSGTGSAELSVLTNAFAVVPEPVSGVLLGSGLIGLAVAGRRRS